MLITNLLLAVLAAFLMAIGIFFVKNRTKRSIRFLLNDAISEFNKALNNDIEKILKRIGKIAHDNRNYQVGYDVFKIRYKEEVLKEKEKIEKEFQIIESLFSSSKEEELKVNIEEMFERVEKFGQSTHNFATKLDSFIKLDILHREEVVYLKRAFREIKDFYDQKRNLAINSGEIIEKDITKIEEAFEEFEILMKKADFVKTKKIIKKISLLIKQLIAKVNLAPQINNYINRIIKTHIRYLGDQIQKGIETNARFDTDSFREKLNVIQKMLPVIELRSKMNNFFKCKELIENNLSNLAKIEADIDKEIKAQEIFKNKKNEVLNALKKTYAITKTLSPLLYYIKNRVTLNNEEKAQIIAFKNKIAELVHKEKIIKNVIAKEVNYNYIQLLGQLSELSSLIRQSLKAVSMIYKLIDNKQSADLRCEREVRMLALAISELSSDILSNKFTKDNETFSRNLIKLDKKICEMKQMMNLKPRNIKNIESQLEIFRRVIENITTQVYTTIQRFKITEKQIMWMSKYRNESIDLNSLLQQAEIAFNSKKLEELEKILNIANQTNIIKKYKGE